MDIELKKEYDYSDYMDVDVLKNIQQNPLADYKKHTKDDRKSKVQKTLKETSLSGDIRLDFANMSDDEKILVDHEFDNFDYCKLIYSAANRKLIFSLGANSHKLFMCIMFSLEYKSEIVNLSPTKIKKLGCKMSPGTLRKAIIELTDKKIINRIGSNQKAADYQHFFINPQMVFRGSSKRYYKAVLHYHPDYE